MCYFFGFLFILFYSCFSRINTTQFQIEGGGLVQGGNALCIYQWIHHNYILCSCPEEGNEKEEQVVLCSSLQMQKLGF